MKVLITGGAGFIGTNLVRYLNRFSPSTEVSVIDDLSMGSLDNLSSLNCAVRVGTILDDKLLSEMMVGIDAVVHLAALGSVPRSVQNPIATHEANVNGTIAVLEASRAAGVEHVIMASSSSVYGHNPADAKGEEDWTRPLSPYGASKLAAESYCFAYRNSYSLNVTVFRFFNVFGPYQSSNHPYAAVIPNFIRGALRDGRVTIFGDGNQSRDFTYVEPVCATISDSLERRISEDRPINLAFGNRTTLLELVGLVEAQIGKKIEIEFLPGRKGDIRSSQASSKLLREVFPRISPTPLPDGLNTTIEWFRESGNS